ncbi:MAG: MFS transporter [Elusimicrobiaceae bacterium]|nr:MFS transporter [Elusimicrobiaceae bacterium]
MKKFLTQSKGWALVIATFVVVFSFSTVDHAISPLVEWLSFFFHTGAERTLWLISSCTAGIVLGLFLGPQLLKTFRISQVLWASLLMMVGGIWAFVSIPFFPVSLLIRLVFGLGAGLFSTVLWWLTYEAIDKRFYLPMIIVLTAARPMAVAAGVPLVLYSSTLLNWRVSFAITGVLIALFCTAFIFTAPPDNKEKSKFTLMALFKTYQTAWKTPHLKDFFTAMLINRLCYFGFYSMLGLWFIGHYQLSTPQLARPLMAIGLCETIINFVVPVLMKIGQKKLFYLSLLFNIVFFGLFAWGALPLWVTILFIGLFAMTDRIYGMLLLIFIPSIFKDSKDRTTIGSLVTLVSWMSLMLISWIEGSFLESIGLKNMAVLLLVFLAISFALYIKMLRKTIFSSNSISNNT